MSDVDTFLAHFGVRGMRWGVRRSVSKRQAAKIRRNSKPSDEGAVANRIIAKQKIHGTRALTNHELRTIAARRELETKFEKLNPPPKTKIDKGHEQVKKILLIAGTAEGAWKLVNSPAGKATIAKANKFLKTSGVITTPVSKVVNPAQMAFDFVPR